MDLKEREEIVWSRLVLLKQNSHSCCTIDIVKVTIVIMMINTCIHVWHREIHRGLSGC